MRSIIILYFETLLSVFDSDLYGIVLLLAINVDRYLSADGYP